MARGALRLCGSLLTFLGPEGPAFRHGDEWSPPLAGFACLCEHRCIAPCQLNAVCQFRAQSFARVKAATCLGHGARSSSGSSAFHLCRVERNHPSGCRATQHRCKTVEAPSLSHGESSLMSSFWTSGSRSWIASRLSAHRRARSLCPEHACSRLLMMSVSSNHLSRGPCCFILKQGQLRNSSRHTGYRNAWAWAKPSMISG
jgi:hypothetical protein